MKNNQKLKFIEQHLKEGNAYSAITVTTKDRYGNPIGQWIYNWRSGKIELSLQEKEILTQLGETFLPKKRKRLTNVKKIAIIRSYLQLGHHYQDIQWKTVDDDNNPIGQWIGQWHTGYMVLTEEEKKILQELYPSFEVKKEPRLSNVEKLQIVRHYLNQGHRYQDITRTTVDQYGNKIGLWISYWHKGEVQLSKEEKLFLKQLGETFLPQVKKLSNSEKIQIIAIYLQLGHRYQDIQWKTMDNDCNPIGRWIYEWRRGRIKLSLQEKELLTQLGETSLSPSKKVITNDQKLGIIKTYLEQGHSFQDIASSSVDANNSPIGKWIYQWNKRIVKLSEKEKQILTQYSQTYCFSKNFSLPNKEKLEYIRLFLEQGNAFDDITLTTMDTFGNEIGRWLYYWQSGKIPLSNEEAQILYQYKHIRRKTKMKEVKKISTTAKLDFIEAFLKQGHLCRNITIKTVDQNRNRIGLWFVQFLDGIVPLTKQERQRLLSFFDVYSISRLTNRQKIIIIQNFVSSNPTPSCLANRTFSKDHYPIGEWITEWLSGQVAITKEELSVLTDILHLWKLRNPQKPNIYPASWDKAFVLLRDTISMKETKDNKKL